MLELRPNCECCNKNLPPDTHEARICSFECTFCIACAQGVLGNICPNCAGALQRLPRNAGRAMIWIYRHTLSPLVGYNCRHLPTCSVYGDEAIERFGLWGGGWMTLARLLRCQPWGTSGIDNVPLTRPPGARWYLPWRFGRWRGVNTP